MRIMKTLLQLTVVLFAGMAISTHAQNRYWVFPPNYVDFYTGQVLPLPNTAIAPATTVDFVDLIAGSSGTISGIPLNKGSDYYNVNDGLFNSTYKSSNGIFNELGELQFYLNNKAYVTNGKTVIYRDRYQDALPILPVPQSCDYFYLIEGMSWATNGINFLYKKISKDASSIEASSLFIAVESQTFLNSILGPYVASPMEYDEQTETSFYRLFTLNRSILFEFKVSHSGISLIQKHFPVMGDFIIAGEMEMSPNGRYIAWANTMNNWGGSNIAVYDLQTSTTQGYRIAYTATGIEFSEDSNRIFFSRANNHTVPEDFLGLGGIGYFTLGTGDIYQIGDQYVWYNIFEGGYITYLNNTANYGSSFIEKAVDGYMYFSDGTHLRGFDPNIPSAGILKSIPVVNPVTVNYSQLYYKSTYYSLPDQNDGIDYANLFQIGCELTRTISNVTSANGSLSPIAKVSQTIETTGTVTVATNTSVTFKAGDQILLKPGFTVAAGGNFRGRLEYCDDFVIDYCSGVGGREGKTETPIIETKNEALQINIYPNPTSGILTVKSPTSVIRTLEVVALSGTRILSLTPLTAETQVDLSPFANGVYVVRITHEKGIETRKVILVK